MKGSKKLLIAIIVVIVVTTVYNYSELHKDIQNGIIILIATYTILTSIVLPAAYLEKDWSMQNIHKHCYFIPLFYVWALIHWIGKLADKYLSD